MALLEVTGVEVRYGTVPALHDFTITVDEGEIVTLLGANGAGKTTTLRMISGLHHASAGSVHFDGVDISRFAAHKTVELGISHVPEGRQSHQFQQRIGLGGQSTFLAQGARQPQHLLPRRAADMEMRPGERVFERGQARENPRGLKGADQTPRRDLARTEAQYRLAIEFHVALVGGVEVGHEIEQRRFSCAIGADHGGEAARGHGQADIGYGPDAAKAFG